MITQLRDIAGTFREVTRLLERLWETARDIDGSMDRVADDVATLVGRLPDEDDGEPCGVDVAMYGVPSDTSKIHTGDFTIVAGVADTLKRGAFSKQVLTAQTDCERVDFKAWGRAAITSIIIDGRTPVFCTGPVRMASATVTTRLHAGSQIDITFEKL